MAGYSLRDYGWMIEDRVRMNAYAEALRAVVRPGDRVLDIGAGTGIFSLIACTLGAGEVVALDPNPAIHVARRILASNGFANRARCVQALSKDFVSEDRFDVIVSDMRGVLPLYGRHLPSIVDARERLLAVGGALIPKIDRLCAAPVEAPDAYARIERPWRTNVLGLDLSAATPFMQSLALGVHLKPERLLASFATWFELDYRTLLDPGAAGTTRWVVERDGVLHGLAVWFDTVLVDGLGFSNAPQAVTKRVYGQLLLPLAMAVKVSEGDTVTATLEAVYANGGYVWRWSGEVIGPGERPRALFEHTDLASRAYGLPFDYGYGS